MAKFTPDLPRPEDNSVTAVRHVDTMSPQEASAPGLAAQRAGESIVKSASDYIEQLAKVHTANMENHGKLAIQEQMDNAYAAATSDPKNFVHAVPIYDAAKAKATDWIAKNAGSPVVATALTTYLQGLYTPASIRVAAWAKRQLENNTLASSAGVTDNAIKGASVAGVRSFDYKHAVQTITDSTMDLASINGTGWAKLTTQTRLANLDSVTANNAIAAGHAQQVLDDLKGGLYQHLTGKAYGDIEKSAQDAIKRDQDQQAAGTSYMMQEVYAGELVGKPSAADIATVRMNLKNKPVELAAFNNGLVARRQAYSLRQQLLESTPVQQAAIVKRVQDRAQAGGSLAKENATVADYVTKQYVEMSKLYATDPAQYGMDLPSSQAALKAPGGQPLDVTTGAGFALQAQHLDAMYTQFGVPQQDRTYLTDAQLATLRQTYAAAPPQAAMNQLQTLEDHIPDAYRNNVMRQLYSKKGLPTSALLYTQGMSADSFAAIKAVDGLTEQKLKADVAESSPNITSELNSVISDKWNEAAPALGAAALTLPYGKTLAKLTYYHVLKGADPETAAQDAFNDMFGQFSFNQNWMFPSNTTSAQQSQIEAYGRTVISTASLNGYRGRPGALKSERAALIANNHWQYIPGHDSYVLLDSNGFMVKSPDGSPISFTRTAALLGSH